MIYAITVSNVQKQTIYFRDQMIFVIAVSFGVSSSLWDELFNLIDMEDII